MLCVQVISVFRLDLVLGLVFLEEGKELEVKLSLTGKLPLPAEKCMF